MRLLNRRPRRCSTRRKRGRNEDAAAAYDEAVRRYGDRTEAAIAQVVSSTVFNKGHVLRAAGRADEAAAAYDEAARRYSDWPEAAIADKVAWFLRNKGD